MVGVPGRSRACLVCKSRRIKCDLLQPACGQCLRSRRECTYARKHIFVHHDEGTHKTVYRKAAREIQDVGRKSRYTSFTNDETDSFNNDKPQSTSLTIQRPIGALTALKQQLLADACGRDLLTSTDQLIPRPWTYTLSAFAGSIHALNSGPLSCYTAWIGRRNREPYLVEASRRLYIQGLTEVQAAVNDPASALLDETLGACLALIVYEALECPDQSRLGYKAHIEGCARIVQLRGTSMHQDGAAHNLFRAFRYIGLLRDVEAHKSSFLSSHPWMSLPWNVQPKSMHDRLLDLLAMAPDVLEKSDRLGQTPPQSFLPALLEVAEEVRAANKQLDTFYAELSEESPEPLYWAEPSRMVNEDESGTVSSSSTSDDTVLRFRDMEIARILTLYWALVALSWSGLSDIHTTLTQLMFANMVPSGLVPIVQKLCIEPRDWLDPVRKVCQSIHYCTTEGTAEMGPLVITVPLDIVTDMMRGRRGCERELSKAIKAGKEIGLHWLQIARFPEAASASSNLA